MFTCFQESQFKSFFCAVEKALYFLHFWYKGEEVPVEFQSSLFLLSIAIPKFSIEIQILNSVSALIFSKTAGFLFVWSSHSFVLYLKL